MTRNEWKALFRRMRSNRGAAVRSEMVEHGGTYWTVHYMARGSDKGLHLVPSIIRDRATCGRVADELSWIRRYRLEAKTHKRNGSYYAPHARNSVIAALACLADCRMIRLSGSRFHTLNI